MSSKDEIDADNISVDPGTLERGENFFLKYPRKSFLWKSISRATVFTVGSISKLFTKGVHDTTVLNENMIFNVMDQAKKEGRGVITVMNHTSTLDDPLVWGGTLPLHILGSPKKMRWTLGAQDIVFRNKFESTFFSLGQVLGVERFGRGPDQPAIDCAIQLVSKRKWVHVYPEGFVTQLYPPYNGVLRYLHWGIARIILESGPKQAIVLPIYGEGLSDIFPEDKPRKIFGYGYKMPIIYAFGEPVNPREIAKLRTRWQELKQKSDSGTDCTADMQQVRSECAKLVRDSLIQTKEKYFGLGEHDLDPRLNDPEFWRSNVIKSKGMSMELKKIRSYEVSDISDDEDHSIRDQ